MLLSYGSQIQFFHLFSCPGRPAQKLQTGLDAGIIRKALNGNAPAQFFPAVMLHKAGQDHFKRYAMQGIVRLSVDHYLFRPGFTQLDKLNISPGINPREIFSLTLVQQSSLH